jgi:hypothetical protein
MSPRTVGIPQSEGATERAVKRVGQDRDPAPGELVMQRLGVTDFEPERDAEAGLTGSAPARAVAKLPPYVAGLGDWPFRFRRLMLSYGCTGDWRSLPVLSRNQLGNDDAYWL